DIVVRSPLSLHRDLHSFPTRRSSDLLAKKLGWKFIDLDEEIERRERRTVADIFRENGEAHFRQLERHFLKQVCSLKQSVIALGGDRKSTRLNSSHVSISYAVFCLKKK